MKRQVRVGITELHVLPAREQQIDALICKVDTLFTQRHDTLIYNESYDLEFVVHPEPYTLQHNSNHVVAQWLRELGMEVRGTPVFGSWRVE